jgi:cellulose synthase operon protein C
LKPQRLPTLRKALRFAALSSSGVILLALLGCDAFVSNEERVSRAEQHLSDGDYGAALVEIKNVTSDNPADTGAQLVLAKVSLQVGDVDAAVKALDRVSSAGVEAAAVAELRARVLIEREQYQELLTEIDAGHLPMQAPLMMLFRAKALKGLRRYTEARSLFTTLVATNAKHTEARIGVAESDYALGSPHRARRELEQLVVDAKDSAAAWVALGTLQTLQGNADAAEVSWKTAIELAPAQLTVMQHVGLLSAVADRRLAHNDIPGAEAQHGAIVKVSPQGLLTELLGARLAVARDEPEVASRSLVRVVEQAPKYTAARVVLASALLAQDSPEQAMLQLDELILQHPANKALELALKFAKIAAVGEKENAARWLAVGNAQLALEQSVAARVALEKAAAREPALFAASAGLVMLDLKAGQFPEAMKAATLLHDKFPAEPAAALLLGDANFAAQKFVEAESAYVTAWNMRKDSVSALALYRARKARGVSNASQSLKSLLDVRPGDSEIRTVYAEALLLEGNRPEAIKQYELVLKGSSSNPVALNNLAWIYYQTGDSRAVPIARKAYELAPRSPGIADTLGWLLVEIGNVPEGVKILRGAVASASGRRDISYHYAAALARGGSKDQAREILSDILDGGVMFPGREAAELLMRSL